MKIVISYPPLNAEKGVPLLSQNRQFQYFKSPTFIYPVVPAQAATMLKENGFEVIWDDAIAERKSYEQWLEDIERMKPDLIAIETKTPVIKQHWKIINDLKELATSDQRLATSNKRRATSDQRLATVLMGDHVTAMPEESFRNSPVDYVITGGDYDFMLLSLCLWLQDGRSPKQDKLAPGIWYRENGKIKNTGKFQLTHDLNEVPFIDRDLTKWKLYAYENGNYKSVPGTYTMAGRDCWWGRCKFCSWTTIFPQFRSRKPENLLDEIGQLINKYQVKEIMDDAGTFPVGNWLREFCRGMIERGYNKELYLDCNMRFNAATAADYKLMKQANFRLLLFGIESANQETLNRLDKNLTVSQIIESCKLARQAGLFPHITIMFGHPWETYVDAKKTLELGRWLLRKGYAYTVQATVMIPYPGTPLFTECQEQGWLKTLDWDRYDMKEPIMKAPLDECRIMKLVQGIYGVAFNPEFLWRRLTSIRDLNDIKYYGRGGVKILGHLFDFKPKVKVE